MVDMAEELASVGLMVYDEWPVERPIELVMRGRHVADLV